MDYDVLIVGGGIAGMEAAQSLGDMGYRILLVEKEASIGGTMILLSKVFPTLDCASCIATPKMAATAHHPNIATLVYSQVKEIERNGNGTFRVKVTKKPTYVDPNLCTGCQQCEFACTVAVPDQFNFGMVGRRAVYIPFPQAVPKKAVIEKEGTSPCSFTCPAGVKAHGYVSLIRSGKFDEAFRLILEDTPLVGALGYACFAPCEQQCTRAMLEGPLPIRKLKRFVADYYYQRHPEPEYGLPEELQDKRVAIVGSGPAGLTAAYHLAKKGYRIKIFEAGPEPGGLLRFGIPTYRLPKEVLDRDIQNVAALGVEIETGVRIGNLKELREQGFDAIFLAVGSLAPRSAALEGEDLEGVVNCLDFLCQADSGKKSDLAGKTILVVGGGNAAVDPTRVALRLNAQRVILQYRRSRAEMPAFPAEIEAAEQEGVEFSFLAVPIRFIGENGRLKEAVCQRMELGEPDESGRRRPMPIPGSEYHLPVDMAIMAIGNAPTTSLFTNELELNRNGSVKVEPQTLQTSLPYVFAGGDVVMGPATIVEACGQGKRAAFHMDRYLRGEELTGVEFEYRLPAVSHEAVLQRQKVYRTLTPAGPKERAVEERIGDFATVELPMTEEEARYSAGRCLDCGVCSECHQCINACPAHAIDLDMKEEELDLEVGSLITSTGFRLFPAEQKFHYGYGWFRNVITAMQMDRLLSPTRPYNTVLRPSDGKVPDNIAYILCTGSRDKTVDNPICSRVCCMYSIKQAQLSMGALPLADITIYYIDIRAFGKGYQEFFEQAKAMGTYFVKGRVSRIEEKEDGNLILHYQDIDNGALIRQAEHDLVVLSVGLLPNLEVSKFFHGDHLEADEYSYVREVDGDLDPGRTSIEGVFVAGAAAAAMDIPDAILHAGAAAAQAAAYVERIRRKEQ
jgi:heterodisulfide reductase subunit A-like polyferredoxin